MLGWVRSPYWGGVLPPSWRTLLFLAVEHRALWWWKQVACSLTERGSGRGRVRNFGEAVLHSLHFSGEGEAHTERGFTGRFRVS